MRHILLILICAVAAIAVQAKTRADIVVFSDPHLMAPALVKSEGTAVNNLAKGDMRMIVQSDAIVGELVKQVLAVKPRLVLVTGDLTKDGELASHKRFITHLDKLRQAGIQVLVIPGNHDINSPLGRYYDGAKTTAAPSVSASEFAQLYRNYGYGSASVRDTASLSYACEPLPGYVVIGIDSNRYQDNLWRSRGDSIDSRPSDGRIKPPTLEWVCQQARQAKAAGKHVIAMMHHQLVEHFDRESDFMARYMVAGAASVREQLLDAGFHVIFTGHLHVTDAARDYNSDRTDSITDVATGSLCTYPLNYRLATLKGGTLSYTTRSIKSIPGDSHLQAQARAQVEQAVPGLMEGLARRGFKKIQGAMGHLGGIMSLFGAKSSDMPGMDPEPYIELMHEQYDSIARLAIITFLDGNEGKSKNSKAIIAGFESGMKKIFSAPMPDFGGGLLGKIGSFMQENAMPDVENLLRSVVEDRNHCGTEREVVVDDHTATLPL